MRELAIDDDIPAMIGFSERDIPTNRLDAEEYERLQEFRDECREAGYFTYADDEERLER